MYTELTKKSSTESCSSTKTEVAVDDDLNDECLDTDENGQNNELLSGSLSCQSLTTRCGCESHQGQLIANQEFDISVDTLFTSIFINSKFMRTYMTRRGVTDTIISNWKRMTPNPKKQQKTTEDNESISSATTLSEERVDLPTVHLDSEQDNKDELTIVVGIKQVRQLNYSMNINHMLAKQVQIEERQRICQVEDGIYVLKSETINSGIPYGESFTVEISYCLTRNGDMNKSRMLIHCFVNFNKEKHNWKLSMIKSLIERQSIQGVSDFIRDLSSCINEYIINNKANDCDATTDLKPAAKAGPPTMTDGQVVGSGTSKRRASKRHSLIRAKSRQKEKKLRSMYRYYIRNDDPAADSGTTVAQQGDERHSDGFSDAGSSVSSAASCSLTSFSHIDDDDDDDDQSGTDSMVMMLHTATDADQLTGDDDDDQVSSRAGDQFQATESINRSFSDVEERNCGPAGGLRRPLRVRCCADGELDQNNNTTTTAVGHTLGRRRSAGAASSPAPSLLLSRPQQLGQLRVACEQPAKWIQVLGGPMSGGERLVALLVSTLSLVLLIALVVSHVQLVRRLDSLELRLHDACSPGR